jgi:hypothetical protein
VGDPHSLFKVGGNRALLEAEDVEFVHVASAARRERRELGAAVFVLGKAEAKLTNCSLTSEQGFGMWLSQKARVRARRCRLANCGRSAIVMFGHGALQVEALEPSDCATLTMDSACTFSENRGVDIHVAGTVRCSEEVASVYSVQPVGEALGTRRGKSRAGGDVAAV